MDRAKTFKEYSLIELYEPQQQQQQLQTQNSAKGTVTKKPKTILRRYVSTGSSTPLGRLRKRIVKSPPPSSPTKKQQPQGSPSSPMRRIQSSHTFAEGSGSSRRGSAAFRRSTSTNNENDSQQFQPLRRVSSTILLGESNDDEEDDENIDGNSCPKWQRVVKEDLGMAGSMLLTTVSRLKEARMQASSMNNNNNNGMSSEQLEDEKEEDDDPQCNDEPTGHLRASSQTFHITSFSSSSPMKNTSPSKLSFVPYDTDSAPADEIQSDIATGLIPRPQHEYHTQHDHDLNNLDHDEDATL